MGKNLNKPISYVAIFTVITLLFSWFLLICCNYPYYFIYDMDHVTALDTVLVHSDMLPDHINHPGSGMYLSLFFSEKIAHYFNALSALNLKDLINSLNPLAAMAELTSFIRLHSPFLVIGIVILLCMAIFHMFNLSQWYLFFFLIVFGTQESLVYHSTMVRTELYSVFYWCCAILMLAIAAKSTQTISRGISLLMTGLFSGLSFLTKIQSLFYLAALSVLLLIAFSIFRNNKEKDLCKMTTKGTYFILAVSLFNIIAFLILGIFSYQVPIPRGIPTWASDFGIMPITVLFFLALLSLFICQVFLYRANKASSDLFMFSSFFSIIAAGFLLSFIFYFFLYSDISLSLNYIYLTFKMVFFKRPEQVYVKLVNLQDFLSYVYYNPIIFIVNIGLNLLLVLGYRFGFIRITKRQLMLCLFITILAFINIILVTRFILRDILWKEVLLNFLNLVYFAIIVTRSTRHHRLLARISVGLLILLFLSNCIHASHMPKRIDSNYNHYGWQEERFFRHVYAGNHLKYLKIMQSKYDKYTAWMAKREAVNHRRIRRTVDFVFKNQDMTHRNIGIVFQGFPAWCSNLDYRIVEVPRALTGAILVDNASIRPKKKTFFKREYVRKHSEYLEKFKRVSFTRHLSVLTRHDLEIFLFVRSDDSSSLLNKVIVKTPYKIVLQNSTKQAIQLEGLRIRNYCEIPLDKIAHEFFFVISKK